MLIFPAIEATKEGLGQEVFVLSIRGSRARRWSCEGSTSCGELTSMNSPGQSVVVVVGARRTAAFVKRIACGPEARDSGP